MRFSNVAVHILLCAVLSFAQPSPATKPAGTKPSAGFSIENIDKTPDPCVDFYQYSCGNCLKNTEIPADQTEWKSFTELYERNLVTERYILQKPSVNDASRSPVEQKIGDRDYYIKDDAKMSEMPKHLTDYATQMFTLAGQSPQQAAVSAQTILRIETALAKASMDRTARRDPKNRDHKMSRDQAFTLASNFYLDRYFRDMGTPSFTELNVANPEFFKQVNAVIESESLDAWKTYVSWHLLDSAAPWLSKPFVDANFKMQQHLNGQAEIQDRWKRCVDATDQALGEALGQKYVDITFGADGKQRMLKMVKSLEKSLDQDIRGLHWMSEDTKKQAKLKLDAIRNKIGYH